MPRRGGRVAVEWEQRINRVCRVKVVITDVVAWEGKCGYDLHADLPAGGATRKHLERFAEGLAADAHLPEGCGVEFRRGKDRGRVVIGVSTVNRLHEDVPYPIDYSPRSIMDPVELGDYRDGSTVGVELREASGLVTGQKGSGKTNLLAVLTLGVARCRDALVWHIDLNGGGMSQPWLHAWLEGQADRPPIDWAAPNPFEALLMVTIALAIAKDRKTSYRKFKVGSDSNLLPLSADLPEIVIVVDEGGEALAPGNNDPIIKAIRNGLEEIQRIGRNEGINPVVSSLRATADLIAPNVKKQSSVRIGMFVQDDEELSFLFGWNTGISTDDLPTKGCGFVTYEQVPPRPFKGRLLRPRQIVEASVVVAQTRPELDASSTQIADAEYVIDGRRLRGLYSTRYQRMRRAFTGDAPELTRAIPPSTDPLSSGPTRVPGATRATSLAGQPPLPSTIARRHQRGPTRAPSPGHPRRRNWRPDTPDSAHPLVRPGGIRRTENHPAARRGTRRRTWPARPRTGCVDGSDRGQPAPERVRARRAPAPRLRTQRPHRGRRRDRSQRA